MVSIFSWKKVLPFILLILTMQAGFTQSYTLQWKKYYGIGGWLSGVSRPCNILAHTKDTGYVAFTSAYVNPGKSTCDRSGRCWVNKFNKYGGLEWQKCYGGTLNYFTYDEPGGIVEAKDGNYLLAGTTSENTGEAVGNHGTYDGWVVKISRTNGNVIWAKCYGGRSVDNFNTITNTRDGGAIVCGSTTSQDGDLTGKNTLEGESAWMMKIDENGNILWQVCVGANYSHRGFYCVKECPDGNIIAAGYSGSNAYAYALKVSSSGVVIWEKAYWGSGNQVIVDCAIGADNEIYLAGNSSSWEGDFSGAEGGFFIFKINSSGNTIWKRFGRRAQNISAITLTTDNVIALAGTTKSFNDILAGLHVSYPEYGWSEADIFIGEMDTSGKTINMKCFGGTRFEDLSAIVAAKNGGYTLFGYTGSNNGDFSDNGNLNGNFLLMKVGSFNTISGKIFYDYNSNNVQDTGEPLFKNVQVVSEKGGGYNGMFTTDGLYTYTVDTGKIDTRLLFVKPYYDVTPVVYTTDRQDYHHYDTINFAVVPRPGINDLSVYFCSEAPPRPGFENTYTLICQNKGTAVAIAGSIRIKADPRVTIINHDSSSFSRNGDTLNLNFANLEPQASFRVKIKVKVSPPPTVNTGDTLLHFIQVLPITGDSSALDNTDTVKQRVVGSYDPNNKLENSGGAVAITKIRKGEYFTYCINFQNTGSDTAFNIVVRDTLEEKLDWRTLDMVASSHSYNLKINNSRNLEWLFTNVKLVDKQHNEPLSHGFILYRIKAKQSVNAGDSIRNKASIYFDYNLPVETNTEKTFVRNLISLPVSLVSFTATVERTGVSMKWQTAYENSSSYFEVERSTDGINFKTIAKTSATNRSTGSPYQVTDKEPNNGYNYYRLKSVDQDGSFVYSAVELVRTGNKSEIYTSVYPNPSKGKVTIQIYDHSREEIQIQVCDFSGKQIMLKQFKNQRTEGFTALLDLSTFVKGIYQISILINKEKHIHKVIVY